MALLSLRRVFLGLGLTALLVVAWAAASLAALAAGDWLSVAVPLAAMLPVAGLYGAARLVAERHGAGRLAADKAVLMRFQSPLLLAHILANPDFLDRPVRQVLAVLFVDLSGFTGVTEALGPERTRDLLAGFQALVEAVVAAQDGYVASFMGDGAMIAFGLPHPRPDDAARALRTVHDLRAALAGWIAALPDGIGERLSVRLGGHLGPAVASRLGPLHHQHIAATGDTVNVASRLLEVAKQLGASAVVSEALLRAADRAATAGLQEVVIRGRAEPLRVRVLEPGPGPAGT